MHLLVWRHWEGCRVARVRGSLQLQDNADFKMGGGWLFREGGGAGLLAGFFSSLVLFQDASDSASQDFKDRDQCQQNTQQQFLFRILFFFFFQKWGKKKKKFLYPDFFALYFLRCTSLKTKKKILLFRLCFKVRATFLRTLSERSNMSFFPPREARDV